MMTLFMHCSLALLSLISPSWVGAVDASGVVVWRTQSLGEALGYMALFAAVGTALAIVVCKSFAKSLPEGANR